MADAPIKIFMAPEMAGLMRKLVGADLVVKSRKVAAPPLKCMEPSEAKPFVGFYGNLYYYFPLKQNPFDRWYYNDGRMDEPCYLPVYQLARHPEDPDSPSRARTWSSTMTRGGTRQSRRRPSTGRIGSARTAP